MLSGYLLRSELAAPCKRLVIKIGSAALAHPEHGVNQKKIEQLVADCQVLLAMGLEIILVSSGAISIGRKHVTPAKVESIDFLQACSAIGQPMLMRIYSEAFQSRSLACAQVLLTHDDIRNRQRSLNLKNMMARLLHSKITPILNENDSVSYAEITVGDNDQLAAMVAEMMDADALLLLSTPKGLYPSDPGESTAEPLKRVAFDENFTDLNLAGKSLTGRGGMKTKLEAVRKLTPLGIPVILGSFKPESPILQALAGGGTFFEARPRAYKKSRQRWLLTSVRLGAVIRVDRGAGDAMRSKSSLLPSGIHRIDGSFRRGDCVKIICGHDEVGTGLVEYSALELRRIQGCQSQDIESILGYCPSKVVIHRDNFALLEPSSL